MKDQKANLATVFEQILTKDEGEKLIESLTQKISSSNFKFRASSLSGELAALAPKLVRNVDPEVLLANLKSQFYQLPVVNLKLAFEPRRTFLKEIKAWFCKNLGEVVIIDLEVDPVIIGGAIIACNNHYCDFSVARRYAFLLSPKGSFQA